MTNLLDEMEANPKAGWRLDEVVTVCRQCGASCLPPRGGGSHFRVEVPGKREKLTIPFKRPIKPVYIRKLAAFLRGLETK